MFQPKDIRGKRKKLNILNSIKSEELYLSYRQSRTKNDEVISIALKALSELVLAEKKDRWVDITPKVEAKIEGWNACCDYISKLILGGKDVYKIR